jgi:hypothetical protein
MRKHSLLSNTPWPQIPKEPLKEEEKLQAQDNSYDG